MRFRRVLVTTALVMILASSLFSGWLAGSPASFKPAAARAQGLNEYQAWFFGITMTDPRITIDSNPNLPVNPPIVEIPSGTNNRPLIRFKLTFVKGNGTIMTSNADWLIFQGYRIESNGAETQLPGLFLLANDNRESIIVSSAGAVGNAVEQFSNAKILSTSRYGDLSSVLGVSFGAPEGRIYLNEGDIRLLFRYIFNKPKNILFESCLGMTANELNITGPKKTPPILDDFNIVDTVTGGSASNVLTLNGDCLNVAGDGWLQHWGIKYDSDPIEAAQCGLSAITDLKDGVGGIILRVVGCFFQYIFKEFGGFLEPYLQSTAKYSSLPKSFFSNKHSTFFVKNYIIGTALAAPPAVTPPKLGPTGDFESELRNKDSTIVVIWTWARSLLDIVVIVALLAIAFANILHLNISTYAAKKALPGLVIGVVGANASLLIIRFMADVTQAVSNFAADFACHVLPGTPGCGIPYLIGVAFPLAIGKTLIAPAITALVIGGVAAGPTGGISLIVLAIIAIVLLLYYFFLVLAFIFTLFKRIIILYFLAMVSPLAFVAYGVPTFQNYFSKWWDTFLRYLFLFPIILFGMAATIRLAKVIGVFGFGSLTDVVTTPGIASIILVLGAATMVLKLPKLVTKGALDVGGMFKKTLATAPRIVAGAQGIRQFAKGGGYESMMAKVNRLKEKHGLFGDKAKAGADAKKLEKAALGKRKDYRTDKFAEQLGKFRGYSTIFGNPSMVQDAFKERQAADTKADIIAAAKTGVLGRVKGPVGDYKAEVSFAAEQLKDLATQAELDDWLGNKGGVGGATKDSDERTLYDALEGKIAGKSTVEERVMLRARIARASGRYEDMQKILDEEEISGHSDSTVARVAQLYRQASTVASRARKGEGDTANTFNKQNKIFPVATTPPATPASPYGGGGAPGGVPPAGGSGGVASPPQPPAGGGGVQNVRVVNPVTILDSQTEALAGRLAEHAQALRDKFSSEQLNAHASSAQSVDDLLSGEIGEAIKRQLGPLASTGGGEVTRHLVSAAVSGGGLEPIRQKLIAGQAIEQTRHSLTTQAAEISDEQLERLGEKITSSTSEATKEIGEMLLPHVNKMATAAGVMADPNLHLKYAQRMIDGFRQVMTQGPKSMRSYFQSNLNTFASTFAKEQNIGHITPASIASAIAHSERPAPPATAAPSITSINKVEQPTTVKSSVPPVPPAEPPTAREQ